MRLEVTGSGRYAARNALRAAGKLSSYCWINHHKRCRVDAGSGGALYGHCECSCHPTSASEPASVAEQINTEVARPITLSPGQGGTHAAAAGRVA